MTPLKIKIGTAVAALATGGGLALALPSSPAVAYSSPPLFLDISIQSPAHLVAKGASVSVPVIVTCNSFGTYIDLRVTEKVGNKVATGYDNYIPVSCNGGHQTLLVTVPASAGVAFAKGTAYAVADISGCAGNYVCGQETASATIQIAR
jgi:hypothetical protein